MANLELNISAIPDPLVKDNFDRIRQALQQSIFTAFQGAVIDLTLNVSVTDLNYPHNLKFKPTDVIVTFQTGAGSVTINYEKFTKEFINISTTGPVTIRLLVGSFVVK